MRAASACPEQEELERLLLGRIDDDRESLLLDHLSYCDYCAQRASSLHAEDDLVASMRQRSPILSSADGEVDTIVERARKGVLATMTRAPGEVGPYHIERLLGAGGMGVVYLARHKRLGRQVALKLVPPGPWGSEARLARFHREAELVARVHHPNVVTLYEIGDWHGSPYLAMEYIEGGSLAERLAKNPLPPRLAAEWLEQLARGVAAAHAVGVIHRDLKPANVLLASSVTSAPGVGRIDSEGGGPGAEPTGISPAPVATGHPKITDFGLARHLDDEEGHTRQGDVLGTPAYMAPEQAESKVVGPACDVYALGAILYECLTGRPPFRGSTALATLEQVRTQEPVAPNQLQPGLPRDLQVITLKCLEKAPARRYPSANALADDLRRWLDGQPITARPGGVGERVLKWARRRPAAAALLTVSVAALAALVGGGVAYERRLRQELGNTERALEQARAEGQRADANSSQAREAIRNMIFRTTRRGWNEVPRLKELRGSLVEEAMAFYEKLAKQEGDSVEVRHDVAWACLEAGKLQQSLGKSVEGRASMERAVGLAQSLMKERPGNLKTGLLHADALASLGAYFEKGDRSAQFQAEAIAGLERLLASRPDGPGVREMLARTYGSLGATYVILRRPADALGCLKQALVLNDELSREYPNDEGHRHQVARTRLNLAQAHYLLRQQAEGAHQEELAEKDFEHVLAKDKHDTSVIEALAVLRVNRSYGLDGKGETDEAIRYVSRNLPMLEEALSREPDDPLLRDRLYRTYGVRAVMEQKANRLADAAASWEKAVAAYPNKDRLYKLLDLSSMWLNAGDHRKGVAVADGLSAEAARQADSGPWVRLAVCYERAAELAVKDTTLAPQEREKIQAHCRVEALAARTRAAFLSLSKVFAKKN